VKFGLLALLEVKPDKGDQLGLTKEPDIRLVDVIAVK